MWEVGVGMASLRDFVSLVETLDWMRIFVRMVLKALADTLILEAFQLYYITNSIGADFQYGILRLGILEFIQNYNYGANWRQIHA